MGYLIGDDMALMHPPKTGGSWAREAFALAGFPWARFGKTGSDGDQHSTEPPPPGRITISVVRHPVNWIRSFWMFHERTNWEQKTDAIGFFLYRYHEPEEPFWQFVRRYLLGGPGQIGKMFSEYTRHADFVGKTESLTWDVQGFIRKYHPEAVPKLRSVQLLERINASPECQKNKAQFKPGQIEDICLAEQEFMRKWGYR